MKKRHVLRPALAILTRVGIHLRLDWVYSSATTWGGTLLLALSALLGSPDKLLHSLTLLRVRADPVGAGGIVVVTILLASVIPGFLLAGMSGYYAHGGTGRSKPPDDCEHWLISFVVVTHPYYARQGWAMTLD